MNKKYERYINYIVNDIELPYFKNMKDSYGLRSDEYELVLSKVYDQPVEWEDNATTQWYNVTQNYLVDKRGNYIYEEDSDGNWIKREYDINGNLIYSETSDGYWYKNEWDSNGNLIYTEDSDGYWENFEYDNQNNLIYHETSDGVIVDNR
jgi:hypothetical protein